MFLFICAAVSAVSTAGCSFTFPLARQQQFGPALPADAPKAEIVQRVNDNIAKVQSWRSTNVQISGKGPMMRIKIGAKVAVESPKHFRLNANSIRGEEADFGCNDERFWFWTREGEPKCVFHARHDQMGQNAQLRQIPFQPDWLMEVLGVVPLNEEELTLDVESTSRRQASLTSERLSPSGRPVKRVILVDTQYGRVLQHSLYDESGMLIAKAKLSHHKREPKSGAILPHVIEIEWPQANNLAMTMEIGSFEVNPASIPPQTFELPSKRGYASLDLGVMPTQYVANPRGGRFNAPDPHMRPSQAPLHGPDDEFVTPVTGQQVDSQSGRVRFDELSGEPVAKPAESDSDLPEWAREPIRTAPRSTPTRRF